MSELFLIIEEFSRNNPSFITWGIATLIVILAIILQLFWIKESLTEYKLNRLLKKIGTESLHNVTIADGMDGKIFIENLILLPNNILLLGVKKYRGVIFAAEKIDLWTQVIGNKSYKFENPLHLLESSVLILNSKIDSTKVEERVLFINGSEFPKGKPDKVVSVSDLKKMSVRYRRTDISKSLRNDWEKLLDMSVKNDFNKDKGMLIDEDVSSGINVFSLMTMVIFLSVWMYWRLM